MTIAKQCQLQASLPSSLRAAVGSDKLPVCNLLQTADREVIASHRRQGRILLFVDRPSVRTERVVVVTACGLPEALLPIDTKHKTSTGV